MNYHQTYISQNSPSVEKESAIMNTIVLIRIWWNLQL